jgi:hypothetical protein
MSSPGFGWGAPSTPIGNPGATIAAASLPTQSQIRQPGEVLGYGGIASALTPQGAIGGFGALSAFPGGAFGPVVTSTAIVAAVAMRRGQPAGPTNDAEIEDFVYDALELIPGTAEVEVRCEGGRVNLTGSVPNKRQKRDIGEIVWAIPAVADVQNNATITARRRARHSGREAEASGGARKHA